MSLEGFPHCSVPITSERVLIGQAGPAQEAWVIRHVRDVGTLGGLQKLAFAQVVCFERPCSLPH